MSKEHDAARVLIDLIEKCDLELKALYFVLEAIRVAHPDFPALSLLAKARAHQPFRDEAQGIGNRLRGITNAAEVADRLKDWPTTGDPS